MPLRANLFRPGSSIQKHAGSGGAAPVEGTGERSPPLIKKEKKIEKVNFDKKKIRKLFQHLKRKIVLKSSETYANFFFNYNKKNFMTKFVSKFLNIFSKKKFFIHFFHHLKII